jgi:hypothetical protein
MAADSASPSSGSDRNRDREALVRRGLLLNYATISYNALEAIVALVAGLLAGSVALVSFGFDSVIEVTASGAGQWRLRADFDPLKRARVERISLVLSHSDKGSLHGQLGNLTVVGRGVRPRDVLFVPSCAFSTARRVLLQANERSLQVKELSRAERAAAHDLRRLSAVHIGANGLVRPEMKREQFEELVDKLLHDNAYGSFSRFSRRVLSGKLRFRRHLA